MKEYLDIIVCPFCKKRLSQTSDNLSCSACNKTYPIEDEIPVFVDPKQIHEYKANFVKYYNGEAKKYNITHGSSLYGTDYNISKYYDPIIKKHFTKNSNILEFGCGTGRFSPIFNQYANQLITTDISFSMLKANANAIPKLCADTENLPFIDNFFDCCVGMATFSYLPDKQKGLKELKRILKNDGKVIIIDQNSKRLIKMLSILVYYNHRKQNRQPCINESHMKFYMKLFNDENMEIVDWGFVSFMPHALNKICVSLLSPIDYLLNSLPFLKPYAMRLYIVAKKK